MKTFEEYLELIGDTEHRAQMKEVLVWIQDSFPELEQKIGWNQPMFTDHGTFIIGFSAAKQHFSVSPEVKAMEVFSEQIEKSGYSQSTNLFRIRWNQPVDYLLLERLILYNRKDKASCSSFWRK